jgi:hypothetical protein
MNNKGAAKRALVKSGSSCDLLVPGFGRFANRLCYYAAASYQRNIRMLSGLKRIASNKFTWILLLALLGAYFRVVAIRETQVDHPIRAGAMDYYVAAYSQT